MANQGPSYGLSREYELKAKSKFCSERAKKALHWIEDVTGRKLDQLDFAAVLRDGVVLCELINRLCPDAVRQINSNSAAPFKQRENLELFLKGCETYGLKSQDLFQVNDLYESKTLYMVVDCLFALGGMAQKKGFNGPRLGVKVADENKRVFTEDQLAEGKTIINLQYGSNQGASQAGMPAFGGSRPTIIP